MPGFLILNEWKVRRHNFSDLRSYKKYSLCYIRGSRDHSLSHETSDFKSNQTRSEFPSAEESIQLISNANAKLLYDAIHDKKNWYTEKLLYEHIFFPLLSLCLNLKRRFRLSPKFTVHLHNDMFFDMDTDTMSRARRHWNKEKKQQN